MTLYYVLLALMTVIAVLFVILPQVGNALAKCASAVLVLAVTLTAYHFLAPTQDMTQRTASHALSKEMRSKIDYYKQHPQKLLFQLQHRVAQQPQDPKGWYLLARLYHSAGRINEALSAYSHAIQLKPDDPKTLWNYAMALSFAPGARQLEHAQAVLKQLIKLQPKDDRAHNLLAMNAYRLGQYQRAITLWENLLPHYSPDSEPGKLLLKAIARAQRQMSNTTA